MPWRPLRKGAKKGRGKRAESSKANRPHPMGSDQQTHVWRGWMITTSGALSLRTQILFYRINPNDETSPDEIIKHHATQGHAETCELSVTFWCMRNLGAANAFTTPLARLPYQHPKTLHIIDLLHPHVHHKRFPQSCHGSFKIPACSDLNMAWTTSKSQRGAVELPKWHRFLATFGSNYLIGGPVQRIPRSEDAYEDWDWIVRFK